MTSAAPPIFLLSFRHRDELAQMAERAGWRAIAARRADAAERRFVASGASVAVVDARRAYADALAVIRLLAEAVEANAAALLVLISRRDVAALDALFAAGATHYLASPFGEAEFAQTLRFARRHAERLAGGHGAATGRAQLFESEAAIWRWRPGSAALALSPALARRIASASADGVVALRGVMRSLDRDGRRVAREAVARLLADARPTAFAHAFGPAGETRIAHHLHIEPDGLVVGCIEDIDDPVAPATRRSRDPLTGIEDGSGMRHWLAARLRSGDARCVLILISVSRFDTINAAYGTATGDAVLQAVARRIERLLGPGKRRARCIARIAGAEFAVGLATPVTLEEAELLAARLAEVVRRGFVSDRRVITLSCRIGVAVANEEDDGEALLRRASAALADAKSAETGAIRVLDASGEAASARDNRLAIDLRVALERDEIELLFQPQVSVTTGAIVGVEALARWRHPVLGELGAATLFAAAERSDYLLQLSEHVQRKTVQLAASWPASVAHLRVAVNVTASDIARTGFAEHFLELVDASGLDRRRLTVEVTESGLIEDLSEAAILMAALRAGGLRVAIDDFGTGYSSLAYLKALPLDYLKIDQHLAQDITGSARDRVVVRGVIEMARSLGLAVIAEGVETEEQLALLAAEGCNYYQGFLCAPPIDQADLERLVSGPGADRDQRR